MISELSKLNLEKKIYTVHGTQFSNPEIKTYPKYYII